MSFKKLSPNTQSITISRFAVEKHGQGKAKQCGPVVWASIAGQHCLPGMCTSSVDQQCGPAEDVIECERGPHRRIPSPPPIKEARAQMSMFWICKVKINDVP